MQLLSLHVGCGWPGSQEGAATGLCGQMQTASLPCCSVSTQAAVTPLMLYAEAALAHLLGPSAGPALVQSAPELGGQAAAAQVQTLLLANKREAALRRAPCSLLPAGLPSPAHAVVQCHARRLQQPLRRSWAPLLLMPGTP